MLKYIHQDELYEKLPMIFNLYLDIPGDERAG